jgi:acyl-CoA reductase-like NAD-dependent aldehyde dehydrogenase
MPAHRYERLFIGGEWVTPTDGEIVETIDPSTGKPWATVAFAGPRDVDAAVTAARAALRGPWSRLGALERAALLRRFASVYDQHAARLADLESRDNGRPIRETGPDIRNHWQWYNYFAGFADKLDGRSIPTDSGMLVYTQRVPVGVVGAIVPWNAPLLLTAWKVAPALAAGCTLVVKPAETTSVTALELGGIAKEAGLPPGVLNVVPGHGRVAGARIVEHPEVDKISFTGEHRTAQKVMAAAAGTLKRFTCENGGKSAHILFADADLDNALNAATHAAFMATGQSCALGSRLLVERSIYPRVVDELSRRSQSIRTGAPLDPTTQLGPHANTQQLEKTLKYVDIGKGEGARLVSGGHRLAPRGLEGGYFVAPTVFADVDPAMRIAQEEIFGPVCSIIPFTSEEEAVAIANGTIYGLTAGLWTRDVGRAHRVAGSIRAGTVWVNSYRYLRASIPYGGFGRSGLGRENGPEALDAFLETRAVIMNLSGTYPDAYTN